MMVTVQVLFAAFSIACFCRLAGANEDEINSAVEHANHVNENWGKWGKFEKCPDGEYAYGFQLRLSDKTGLDDGVGVDEMALVCGDKKRRYPQHISSTEGRWGKWFPIQECPDGEFLVGFQTRHLRPNEGHEDNLWPHSWDDKGVTNLKMSCSGGKTLHYAVLVDEGTWMKNHMCKKDAYICGISTFLMNEQGGTIYDDEGLTAVKMKCCDTTKQAENSLDV